MKGADRHFDTYVGFINNGFWSKKTQTAFLYLFLVSLCIFALSGCGGGGGGGGSDRNEGPVTGGGVWQSGVFQGASLFANQCAMPRTGNDVLGNPVPDSLGAETDEKNFLRSWSNDTYLWYDEIADRDPGGNHSVSDYFDLLVTGGITSTGALKDNFHFSMSTEEWQLRAQSGVSAGYGANWILTRSRPENGMPREVIVTFPEPNSPAALAGLHRGDRIITVDGEDFEFGNEISTLNAGLFPEALGETHNFEVRDVGNNVRSITMTSASVTQTPVPIVETINTGSGSVGYILFNSHIATAEAGLVDAFDQLEAANVTDLVLDLRYNGGGFLAIASQLAYMIAGDNPTASAATFFENSIFNDKHPVVNPVTGALLEPMPFINETIGFNSLVAGQPLPTLNLSRVYVLTGSNTCSASESIINGLRGVDVDVIQIGSTTCGKPYGFYPQDNCGETYFSIQFQGQNAKGFGDFPDGFAPNNAGGFGVKLPGCSVQDDFFNSLGNIAEDRLQAALEFRATGLCPPANGVANNPVARSLSGNVKVSDGQMFQAKGLQGKIRDLSNEQ